MSSLTPTQRHFAKAMANRMGFPRLPANEVLDSIERDKSFLFETFQAHIKRDGKLSTLGRVADYLRDDGQFSVNPKRVKDILTGENGVARTLTLFEDPVVITDGEGLPLVASGRHRIEALLQLLDELGFTENQARAQKIRVQQLDTDPATASRFVVAANQTRTMVTAERKSYTLQAEKGIDPSNLEDLLSVVDSPRALPDVVGLALRVRAIEIGELELTSETLRKIGSLYIRELYGIYGRPLVVGVVKSDPFHFIDDLHDRLATSLAMLSGKGELPANLAREFRAVVLDMLNDVELPDSATGDSHGKKSDKAAIKSS